VVFTVLYYGLIVVLVKNIQPKKLTKLKYLCMADSKRKASSPLETRIKVQKDKSGQKYKVLSEETLSISPIKPAGWLLILFC